MSMLAWSIIEISQNIFSEWTVISHWDFSVFVDADFDISMPRAIVRDVEHSGVQVDADLTREKYNQRYVPGQLIYLQEAQPKSLANIIFNNNDFEHPRISVNS